MVATATSVNIADLWRRLKSRNDQKARDQIINHYAYLVKITAGRVVTSLPPNLEREDLVSAGVMGLIKAVDQFDTARQAGSRFGGNNGLNRPLSPSTHREHGRWRIPMEPFPDVEPILIVIVVVLLFGGGYWGRRHGHW